MDSKYVVSSQSCPHERLSEVVAKHLQTEFRKPFAAFSLVAFAELTQHLTTHGGPLVFDSGCGTGESTIALSKLYPECLVVGLDKSPVRLSRANACPENCQLIRGDVIDLWRLAVQAGWQLKAHYLLYPNPWPKKEHLLRRWPAHPVFPALLALGGRLELRTNWDVYAQEFAEAILVAIGTRPEITVLAAANPLSAHERKYQASGHKLYQVAVGLTS